jgi:hypothetical protein
MADLARHTILIELTASEVGIVAKLMIWLKA